MLPNSDTACSVAIDGNGKTQLHVVKDIEPMMVYCRFAVYNAGPIDPTLDSVGLGGIGRYSPLLTYCLLTGVQAQIDARHCRHACCQLEVTDSSKCCHNNSCSASPH